MKKLFPIFMALCAALQAGAADEAKFIACQGKVLPSQSVSRLAAYSPSGAQAVIEKLLVKEGDEIKAGKPVAEIKGIQRAKLSHERALEAVASAKAAADIKILQQKNLIADLEGTFAQNKKILDEKDPPRREREQIDYEQTTLLRHISQAQAMMPLVEAAQKAMVKEAEASANEAWVFYNDHILLSPLNGKVLSVFTKEGEAQGSEGVCEIADTSKMYVEAEVYFSDVLKVKLGAPVEILSDALKGKLLKGKVSEISQNVKPNKMFNVDPNEYADSRVVTVKIEIENTPELEKIIGSQVNARISVAADAQK